MKTEYGMFLICKYIEGRVPNWHASFSEGFNAQSGFTLSSAMKMQRTAAALNRHRIGDVEEVA